MFGASEDRARQLAGRQRWKRIGSHDSRSSRRSASSSSQLSQLSHCETLSIFTQNIQWPTASPEYNTPTFHDFPCGLETSHVGGESPAVSSHVEKALSQMVTTNQHPRTQQQRSQAEHLSQVLYNDVALDDQLLPSSISFVLPTQLKQYGVLGWGAKVLHQVRHTTVSASQKPAQDESPDTATSLDATPRSVTSHATGTQTAPSLRGGAGYSDVEIWNMAMDHSRLYAPFNTGVMYRYFVDSLPAPKMTSFKELFDDSEDLRQLFNLPRQMFYQGLDFDQRQSFLRMLFERAKFILGSALHGVPQSQNELLHIDATSVAGDRYPLVDLERLGIAVQPLNDPAGFR